MHCTFETALWSLTTQGSQFERVKLLKKYNCVLYERRLWRIVIVARQIISICATQACLDGGLELRRVRENGRGIRV